MLWRKLLRDLWSNKVQFISILLMAALSTYIYVGMASVWNGLQYARNEYYDKSNYADYIVSSSNGFTTHDIENLEGNKDIGNIELRYRIKCNEKFINLYSNVFFPFPNVYCIFAILYALSYSFLYT